MDASGLSCVDIDECSENNNICRNGECTNMEGSFQCKCLDGFVLGGSRRNTCIDHDECVLNPFICGKNGKIYSVLKGGNSYIYEDVYIKVVEIQPINIQKSFQQ